MDSATTNAVDNGRGPKVSIVIPALNEAGNIRPLIEEIRATMSVRMHYEVVVVDDASSDGTWDEIRSVTRDDPSVRCARHDRVRGQSSALHTGIRMARAPIVVVLDGDGQNDPADVPSLVARLVIASEARMVAGCRQRRDDSLIRRWSSIIANRVRRAVLDDGIPDTGCGIKAFYRDDFLAWPAFDHMHRFLPALVQRSGGKVLSVPVNHRPRTRGQSKYGVSNRLWVGIVDLFGVLWLKKRAL